MYLFSLFATHITKMFSCTEFQRYIYNMYYLKSVHNFLSIGTWAVSHHHLVIIRIHGLKISLFSTESKGISIFFLLLLVYFFFLLCRFKNHFVSTNFFQYFDFYLFPFNNLNILVTQPTPYFYKI